MIDGLPVLRNAARRFLRPGSAGAHKPLSWGAAALLAAGAATLQASAGGSLTLLVHIPAAWLALVQYAAMAVAAGFQLAQRRRAPALWMTAIAPTGIAFTALALWTGMLWGGGNGWDPRMTCGIVLLGLYTAVLLLRPGVTHSRGDAAACALLVVVGALNLPILYLALEWWHHAHGGAGPHGAVARPVLSAVFMMTLAFCLYANAAVLGRLRGLVARRELRP
jgi:heme exporter protein C